jgi:DNA polymerase-3 subunit gamma/tau
MPSNEAPKAEAEQSTPAAGPMASTGPLQIDDWTRLVERSSLGGPVGQLALHAVLLGVDGNVLRLGLKAGHEHLASSMMVELLEKRLSESLGRAIRVRIEKVAEAGSVAESPADTRARNAATRQQQAHDGLHADPVVQSIIDTFDARILPESVRPLEK